MKLRCSDGRVIEADRSTIQVSNLLHTMIEDLGEDLDEIPVPNVDSKTMAKTLEYCSYIVSGRDDPAFVRQYKCVTHRERHALMSAANYLDIEKLCDLWSDVFADLIQGKSPREIRELLEIPQVSDDSDQDPDPEDVPSSAAEVVGCE